MRRDSECKSSLATPPPWVVIYTSTIPSQKGYDWVSLSRGNLPKTLALSTTPFPLSPPCYQISNLPYRILGLLIRLPIFPTSLVNVKIRDYLSSSTCVVQPFILYPPEPILIGTIPDISHSLSGSTPAELAPSILRTQVVQVYSPIPLLRTVSPPTTIGPCKKALADVGVKTCKVNDARFWLMFSRGMIRLQDLRLLEVDRPSCVILRYLELTL